MHDDGQFAHLLLRAYFPSGQGMHWPPLNYPSEHDKHELNEHVVQLSPNFTVHGTQERPLRLKVVDGQSFRHFP